MRKSSVIDCAYCGAKAGTDCDAPLNHVGRGLDAAVAASPHEPILAHVEVSFDIHDTDWWLDHTRGEFLAERETHDDGELGVYHAPIPAETVQLSEGES